MLEAGQRLGFAHQAGAVDRVNGCQVAADPLQGDPAVERRVVDGVYVALAAPTDPLEDHEAPDHGASRQRVRGGGAGVGCGGNVETQGA